MNLNCPAKWKKQQILVDFGLRMERELNRSIKRFQINAISDISIYCERQLKDGKAIRIIAVTREYMRSLPNYVIDSINSLQEFRTNSYLLLKSNFIELWCSTSLSKKEDFFGRLYIDVHDYQSSPMIMETIRANSARAIEKYNGQYDYTLTTPSWDSDNIDVINCSEITMKRSDLIDTARQIWNSMYHFMPQLTKLIECLDLLSINALCIEFIYDKTSFCIIDFDTDNDAKAIKLLYTDS